MNVIDIERLQRERARSATLRCAVISLALLMMASAHARAAAPPLPEERTADAARYERWFLSQCDSELFAPEYRAKFAEMRARHSSIPEHDRWPVDTDRGILVNEAESGPVSRLRWLEREVEGDYDGPVGNWLWMNILLCNLDDPHITPVLCEPDACYFTSPRSSPTKGRPIFVRPGIWVALREHEGRTVLAGVLIHRTAPKDPVHDPLFLKWRAELATRYPIAPVPATDPPASWAEAIVRGAVGALRTALRAP